MNYYQGGIVIGDGTLIGHNTVLATLDHDIAPDKRHLLHPAPIHIGSRVWIGAGVLIAGIELSTINKICDYRRPFSM